ncbi:phosphate/phosphite/phosphonate ABC transporter substrate-binding protein [Sulfurimonas lithotrophica]|uniref:Phosphate/phosphite/phosphonate ABC transporter substrate-binding protein n=1 Tax=Sulfurimonas lithotrophica TaxID=2590022 RepID=A0A5P8NYC1_9BACT|nr:phosphate/phosphite/phosphonate ABC transporter substrate-binding protein [Sulfurimonas lithotrophica]QFR48410.1 phosphate/phosphite/phosphonate ABC transporter substrate-binding protein [Sulfurimonas lithotrophica]
MKFVLSFFILFYININAKDIVFGVVPQQSPHVLLTKWLPITKELSKISGYNIIFKTESSITKFEKELYEGKYDIAYMNPYHFVIANKLKGYNAVARSKKSIQGIVLGTKKMLLNKKSIQGSTFLFPAPKAFAATLLTKYELKKKFGIDIDKNSKVLYVNSHDSVYKGLARNIGDFGGGIVRTFNNMKDKEVKNKVSILYKTSKYPSHPIAINPKLPENVQKKLKTSIFKISTETFKKLNIPNIIQISNDEYKSVKQLAIELNIY